jgi:hypothetical protein
METTVKEEPLIPKQSKTGTVVSDFDYSFISICYSPINISTPGSSAENSESHVPVESEKIK